MDHIFIRDFRVETLIGFHRRERIVPQTLRLDLEIGIANRAVFESDKVSDCIDYELVSIRIRELERIWINGGRRGFLVAIAPAELVRTLNPGLVEVALRD